MKKQTLNDELFNRFKNGELILNIKTLKSYQKILKELNDRELLFRSQKFFNRVKIDAQYDYSHLMWENYKSDCVINCVRGNRLNIGNLNNYKDREVHVID